MLAFLILIAVGIVLMVFGISNLKGNINSIHSYHRNRVKEEDKHAFGKLMGIGMIFCSIGVIAFGLLSLLAEMLAKEVLIIVGSYAAVAGLAIGVTIMIITTIKYNKGLF